MRVLMYKIKTEELLYIMLFITLMVNIQWLNYQHPKVAKLLLNYGADPSFIHRPKAITAGITVGILAAIVAPLVLICSTALSALAILQLE